MDPLCLAEHFDGYYECFSCSLCWRLDDFKVHGGEWGGHPFVRRCKGGHICCLLTLEFSFTFKNKVKSCTGPLGGRDAKFVWLALYVVFS